tara:strand:+ start:22139 stop:23710 length:1572 start_codon:yes stop_codon:yes gene_type:complete
MASKNPFDEIADFRENVFKGEVDLDATLNKNFICDEIKGINEKDRTIRFVISTDSVDRMGDTIAIKGWDLKAFKKAPTVLWAHDARSLPIAKASDIKIDEGKLKATAEFATRELNEFADSVFKLYLGGFIKSVSVGFRPTEYKFVDDDDTRPYGIDFLKQELLEFSAVPIPANADALIDAKARGIDLAPLKGWAEKILDEWEDHNGLAIPRKTVEAIRKQAGSTPTTFVLTPTEQDALLARNLEKVREGFAKGGVVNPAELLTGEHTNESVVPIKDIKEADGETHATNKAAALAVADAAAIAKEIADALSKEAADAAVKAAADAAELDAIDDAVEAVDAAMADEEIAKAAEDEDDEDDEEVDGAQVREITTALELAGAFTKITNLCDSTSDFATRTLIDGDDMEKFLSTRSNLRLAEVAVSSLMDAVSVLRGILDAAAPAKTKKKTKKAKKSKRPEAWEDEEVLLSFMDEDEDDDSEEEEFSLDGISAEDIASAIKSAVADVVGGSLIADVVKSHIDAGLGKS